jgi:large subunit ribosomal protein L2
MNNLKFYCKTIISKIRKFGILSHSGRNFLGRVCVKGRGGGKKKIYRFIDFFRRINKLGKILKILYDCNRTSYIALILYKNGLNSFIIATENLKIFDSVFSGNIYFEASNTEIG